MSPKLRLVFALNDAVKAVCPIQGVCVRDTAARDTWRINYEEAATPAQRAAAQRVLAEFTFDANALLPEEAARAAAKQAIAAFRAKPRAQRTAQDREDLLEAVATLL